MDRQDRFGLFELRSQTAVLPLKLSDPLRRNIWLWTRFGWGVTVQQASVALTFPVRDRRVIQPLSAQQRTQFAGLCAGGGSFEDRPLESNCKLAGTTLNTLCVYNK